MFKPLPSVSGIISKPVQCGRSWYQRYHFVGMFYSWCYLLAVAVQDLPHITVIGKQFQSLWHFIYGMFGRMFGPAVGTPESPNSCVVLFCWLCIWQIPRVCLCTVVSPFLYCRLMFPFSPSCRGLIPVRRMWCGFMWCCAVIFLYVKRTGISMKWLIFIALVWMRFGDILVGRTLEVGIMRRVIETNEVGCLICVARCIWYRYTTDDVKGICSGG